MLSEQQIDTIPGMSNAEKVRVKNTVKQGKKAVAAVTALLEGKEPDDDGAQGVAGKRLLSFIERVERLETERDALSQDIREVFSEAKAVGFEVKIMRKLLKLRRIDTQKRAEEQALLETYAAAIGMQYALPL